MHHNIPNSDNFADYDSAPDFANFIKDSQKDDFQDSEIGNFLYDFLIFWYDNFFKNGEFNIYIGVAFEINDNMDSMDIYWYFGSCNTLVLDIVNAGIQFTTVIHRSIEDIKGDDTYFSLGASTPFAEAAIGIEYSINSQCETVSVGSYLSAGAGVIPFVDIEGGKCCTPKVMKINDDITPPIIKWRDYVKVDFSRISILKTNADAGPVEEWHQLIAPNTILNFIDYLDSWKSCSFSSNTAIKMKNIAGNGCKPPKLSSSSYDCYIQGSPQILVPIYVFENGLKYIFDFQIGDFDGSMKFDNGPKFDLTYTEKDHTSIDDLPKERYFTRNGPEGRRARLYVTYELFEDYIPQHGDINLYTCQ